MPQLRMTSAWTIELGTEELRLILKALGGRLKDEDVPLAKELGDTLTNCRITETRSRLMQTDQLFRNLQAATGHYDRPKNPTLS